ncbi:hypothetical protein AKJ57_02200 [candidate division MSBL1 archaeon SCGC-AAA259A05]|uniref:Uncharacterized protein n=1 Tax=candidate division MSBL1 archaeon SCGC-AAA259A05 TaxID=1698259 RepID=A0A133UAF7_9EURY|nr:hypothetical protein AKJ57_02200 [candidate division MSBL1 archaeon SCGC-AAA259A05]
MERSLDVELPELVRFLRSEELPSLLLPSVPVEPVVLQDVVYRGSGETDSLNTGVEFFPHEFGEVDERLLYPRGAPAECGPEGDDRVLDFRGDFSLFWLSRQILKAFSAAMVCSLAPFPDRLPADSEGFCHRFFTKSFPNQFDHLAAFFGLKPWHRDVSAPASVG